jgi:hypothetical protein
MCFSFEVSIATFLFSWITSIYLLNKGLNGINKQNIIFLMIFSSIQLADAVLWYNNMEENKTNYMITSFIIPLLLSCQILYNVYGINDNKNNFISLIVIIGIIYIFNRFNGYSKSLCNNTLSSPIWGSKEIKLWELVLFLIFILYPDYMGMLKAFIVLSLIKIFIGGAYGTLWCAIANLMSLYYLYKY